VCYSIVSPDVLKKLDADRYFICLLTEKHHQEIKNDIRKLTEKEFCFLEKKDNISTTYPNIDELFTRDVYVHKKCMELNISIHICEYIKKTKKLLESLPNNTASYTPIKKGHKLCILAMGENTGYIITYSDKKSMIPVNTWHRALGDVKAREDTFGLYERVVKDTGITLYVDKDILLQKYCGEKVNYKDDNIRRIVLSKLKDLHNSSYKTEISADPYRRFSDLKGELDNKSFQKINSIIEKNEMKQGNAVVFSHGDLHPGNIVFDKGECFFIDWEFMCMTNAMYDVCRFLFYSQIDEHSSDLEKYDKEVRALYLSMDKYLDIYYARNCSSQELTEAKNMLFLCEGISILIRINRKQENSEQMIEIVEDHSRFLER
jgi:thiamine kinase-like enzyme